MAQGAPIPPLFIVGAPRSGTTLLAAMLSAHSRIAIGPETHFFRLLDDLALAAASARNWPEDAADLVADLRVGRLRLVEQFETAREDVARYLGLKEPSEQALLESLVASFARKKGKARWGEKTPNHVLHLPRIRRLYPDAHIIHIVRDPRDAAVSMCRLPTFPDSVVANAYIWREWVDQGLRFASEDPRVLLVRFEDLLQDPENELREISTFVGEEFEPGMLETSGSADGLRRQREVWKSQVGEPLDPTKAFRWRRSGPDSTSTTVGLICHREIQLLGYETAPKPVETLDGLWLTARTAAQIDRCLLRLAERGTVVRPVQEPLRRLRRQPSTTLICGWPASAGSRLATAKEVATFAIRMLKWRLVGRPVPYLDPGAPGGKTERIGRWVARRLGAPFSRAI